jgi:DNA-binding NarL/FixJ family response regulator
VLIVDDGDSARRALRLRLDGLDDLTVVAEARNAEEAAQQLLDDCADVALLSGTGPNIDWSDAVGKLKQQCGDVKVVVLAPYEQDAARAIDAGASAHLLKESDVGVLADAIRRVVARRKPQSKRSN